MKDLSIIILNYRQSGLVKYLLRRLVSDPPKNLDYEIIVVDNASKDDIEEVVAKNSGPITLIKSKSNKGYASGNNLGMKKAEGKYILILNPDILISGKDIELMVEWLKNHPQVGMVGPKINNPDGTLQYSCSRFPDWRLPFFRRTFLGGTTAGKKWTDNYLMLDFDHQSDKAVDWLFGACLLVRAEALKTVGLLDERYFLYMEDLDWCRRFWEKNWEVWYTATASAIHFHHRQSAEGFVLTALFSRSARIHLTSWFKYFWKFLNKQNPRK